MIIKSTIKTVVLIRCGKYGNFMFQDAVKIVCIVRYLTQTATNFNFVNKLICSILLV